MIGSMRVLLACLVVLGNAGIASIPSAAQTYRIDPQRSTAEFVVNHLGFIRERGRFDRPSGTIMVDPAGVAGGTIEVVIDLASVNTGWDLRDDFLRSAAMFDVARYPVMRFRSHHLEYRDRGVVAADGDITLHGVTRPLRLEVKGLVCSAHPVDRLEGCGAIVTGRVLRRDFGISFAYPLVGDDVDLEFAIVAPRVGD